MEKKSRIFNCLRCSRQTVICSHCDRGQIYCGRACSQTVRKVSLTRANRQYQNSHQGKIKHAARQRNYRARSCKNKVTYQGSPTKLTYVSLPNEIKAPAKNTIKNEFRQNHCHFCSQRCSYFVRRGFLSGNSRQTVKKTARSQGP